MWRDAIFVKVWLVGKGEDRMLPNHFAPPMLSHTSPVSGRAGGRLVCHSTAARTVTVLSVRFEGRMTRLSPFGMVQHGEVR